MRSSRGSWGVYYYGFGSNALAKHLVAQNLMERFPIRFNMPTTWENVGNAKCDVVVISRGDQSTTSTKDVQLDVDALLPYTTPGTMIFLEGYDPNVPSVALKSLVQDGNTVVLAHYQSIEGANGFIEAMVPSPPSVSNSTSTQLLMCVHRHC